MYDYCCTARCFPGGFTSSRNGPLLILGNPANARLHSRLTGEQLAVESCDPSSRLAISLHCSRTSSGCPCTSLASRCRPESTWGGFFFLMIPEAPRSTRGDLD